MKNIILITLVLFSSSCSRNVLSLNTVPLNQEAHYDDKGYGKTISVKPSITGHGIDISIDGVLFANLYAASNEHGLTLSSQQREVFWITFKEDQLMPSEVRRIVTQPAGKNLVIYGDDGAIAKTVPMK